MSGFRKICLVGFDRQIGSFALGLKRVGFAGTIVGVAEDPVINACWKMGMINDGFTSLGDALPGANLIMLSSVSSHVSGILPQVLDGADEKAVISEMTRVKGDINRVIEDSHRDDVHYVGFRMIGDVADVGNFAKSDKFFFEGKTVILTPRDKRDLEAFAQLQDLMRKMGAEVVAMSPMAHDRLLAQIHHVPKAAVLAVLQRLFSGTDDFMITPALMGKWLTGETRELVESHKMGWVEEVEANRELVLEGIDELITRLHALKDDISHGGLSGKLETLAAWAPGILGESVSSGQNECIIALGKDPKNLERVSEILARAHIKLGKLDLMQHAAPGTYRLTMATRDEIQRAAGLLRSAGFEITDLS